MYMNEDAAEAVAASDPSGGWAGLRQPDQAGQAVDADSTEVVAVGWSGALDLPNDSVDLEPRFAALVVVQEHFRLRDQILGKALIIGGAQVDGRHTAMDHVRYVHR